jgi:MYXO-CTERM domain-containing protein
MPAADATAGVTHGLAYLTIPEPSGAALAAVAIAALTLLARRSSSRPA